MVEVKRECAELTRGRGISMLEKADKNKMGRPLEDPRFQREKDDVEK